MSSAADKASRAEKHLGMLFGKAETLRTEAWRAIHNRVMNVGEKRPSLEALAEARELWKRIYDAAAQMLPGDPVETQAPVEIADDEAEVNW